LNNVVLKDCYIKRLDILGARSAELASRAEFFNLFFFKIKKLFFYLVHKNYSACRFFVRTFNWKFSEQIISAYENNRTSSRTLSRHLEVLDSKLVENFEDVIHVSTAHFRTINRLITFTIYASQR